MNMKKYALFVVMSLIFMASFINVKETYSTTTYKIGIFYVVTTGQTLDTNWRNVVDQGMSLAIPRLNQFFSSYGISWTHQKLNEININYIMIPDLWRNLPSGLYKTVVLINQAHPTFVSEYQSYDLTIFLFAGNFAGAYSYDYKGPIYASHDLFQIENANMPIIEHEILHVFGLPDHNSPHTNPIYDNCLMGNLYMSNINLCSECLSKLNPPKLGKSTLEELGLMPQINPSPSPNPSPSISPSPTPDNDWDIGTFPFLVAYRAQIFFFSLIGMAIIYLFFSKVRCMGNPNKWTGDLFP